MTQNVKKLQMSESVLTFGTYEGGIVSMKVSLESEESHNMETIISTPSHIGCVRAIGSSRRFSVSGGTDELINVFDVSKCRHLGNMGGSVHTSTITALDVSDEHGILVSGCDDGQIAITRLKDFETLRSFKGHKSAVMGIAIHPSGKVAISASTDNTLRMWDLTRGTCAAVRSICPIRRPNTIRGRVSAAVMDVKYTPLGSRYAMLLPSGKIEICSSSSVDVVEYDHPLGVTSICPLTEELFAIGDSKGNISILEIDGLAINLVVTAATHASRVRGIARIASKDSAYFASVCVEGKIVLAQFNARVIHQIRDIDTGLRVTCFTSNC